jgi:CheY-like chemotaxis protein
MARIIHVDDGPEWIELVRRVLADHSVDSADSYDEALRLIRSSPPYDLALIDLNLAGDDDIIGGELLDLLRMDFPATRRIVITGSPPAGDMRTNIFERYDLENVIIKGKTTLPGLRLVVIQALRQDAGGIPAEVKAQESELMERYHNWRDSVEEQISGNVRDAENKARHIGRIVDRSAHPSPAALSEWIALRERFAGECTRLETIFSAIRAVADVKAGTEQLEQAMGRFATEIRQLQ